MRCMTSGKSSRSSQHGGGVDRRVLSLIKHGHYRHLERLYAIKRYLNRQSLNYGKAERALGEALEGPIEY
jgi:hypothetical protein